MKPTITLLLCLSSYICIGQTIKEDLSDIKNKYQLIRELVETNTLRQYHTNYPCKNLPEKGNLTFYYNGNELKYIMHTYTQEHIKYRNEFYIWDDQLFFQYTTYKIWYKHLEKQRYGKYNLVDVTLTLEKRFYFKGRNIIKCQFKNFENRSNKPKKIKTNHVKNISIGCDQAQNSLKEFDDLMCFQENTIKDACNLPRSISNTESLDIIYNNTTHN